jgi:hypothetical protein
MSTDNLSKALGVYYCKVCKEEIPQEKLLIEGWKVITHYVEYGPNRFYALREFNVCNEGEHIALTRKEYEAP